MSGRVFPISTSVDITVHLYTEKGFMYYLQHERPCCIGRYKLEPKARVCMSDTTRTRLF